MGLLKRDKQADIHHLVAATLALLRSKSPPPREKKQLYGETDIL